MSEKNARNTFKMTETADIDLLLIPMVRNEPRIYQEKLLSDASKHIIFENIFDCVSPQLLEKHPTLTGRVDARVLQQRWKNIKDSINKNIKNDKNKLSEYQRNQLLQTSFCHEFLSNYNKAAKDSSSDFNQGTSQSLQEENFEVETIQPLIEQDPPSIELPSSVDQSLADPPATWLPGVKDAARRRLEWITDKRMKLAQGKDALLHIDDEQRQIDPNFKKRKVPAKQSGSFDGLIQHFETLKTNMMTSERSSWSWARMVNYHILKFPEDRQQAAFDTALEIMSRYTNPSM